MADYKDEEVSFGLELIDELILKVTPDAIIAKTDELVTTAVDMDMTGAEKFQWVLDQVQPLLSWLIRNLGPKLVQLVYEMMKARNA